MTYNRKLGGNSKKLKNGPFAERRSQRNAGLLHLSSSTVLSQISSPPFASCLEVCVSGG